MIRQPRQPRRIGLGSSGSHLTTSRTSYGCTLSGLIGAGDYFLKIGSTVGAALVVEGNGSAPSYVQTVGNGSTYTASNTRANLLLQGSAATVPVPEPATWAMMVAGFGVAGYALRRRRDRLAVRFA